MGFTAELPLYNCDDIIALGVPTMSIPPRPPTPGARHNNGAAPSVRGPQWARLILGTDFPDHLRYIKSAAMTACVTDARLGKAIAAAHRLGGFGAVAALLRERFAAPAAHDSEGTMCTGAPAVRVMARGTYREEEHVSPWGLANTEPCQRTPPKARL